MTVAPFSLMAVPIVAVACTTASAFGASDGGVTVNVTVNVAVTGCPDATVPNTVGPSVFAVQP